MLFKLATFPILGKPLVMYFGLLTLTLLLSTASVPIISDLRKRPVPLRLHHGLAYTTIGVALSHALLALSLFYKLF